MRTRIAFYLYVGLILGLVAYQVSARHLALAAVAPQVAERKVSANTVISERDPKIKIEVPETAKYVGADRWILYGIADCEIHAYVDADAQNNVQRLYWIQFEQYIPEKPDLHHNYDSPRHTQIGGLDFYVDTWPRANHAEFRAGSDREHIEALVKAKGYKMPAGMGYVRLVHLWDPEKRKELMIIYGEALPAGVNAADLDEKGKDRQTKWPAVEQQVIEGVQQRIKITQ
jgi:hypothetical protein